MIKQTIDRRNPVTGKAYNPTSQYKQVAYNRYSTAAQYWKRAASLSVRPSKMSVFDGTTSR